MPEPSVIDNRLVAADIFSHNFRKLIDRSGTQQRKLAADLGVGEVAVSCWVNGSRFPTEKYIVAIADYFHVPIYSLFLKPGEEEALNKLHNTNVTIGDLSTTAFVGTKETADFAFVVYNDEMSPDFERNDIVFCKSASSAKNGDIVIIEVNGKKNIRRVYYTPVSVLFVCSNPKFSPQQYIVTNQVTPKIVGYPIAFQRICKHQ